MAESTVKERLVEYINYKGESMRAFSLSLKHSENFVSNIRESIQPKTLYRIAVHYPDLDIGWLMTGIGEMLKPQLEDSNSISEPSPEYGQNKIEINYSEFKSITDLSVSQQEVIRKQSELIDELSKALIELLKKK